MYCVFCSQNLQYFRRRNRKRRRPAGDPPRPLDRPLNRLIASRFHAVPVLAGIGTGAEFRIYDGAVSGADTRDPDKAKATVVVAESTELNARVNISAAKSDRPKIKPGDLALLVRPADKFITLKVRLRPSRETGGIPDERARKLRSRSTTQQFSHWVRIYPAV